MWIHPSFDPTLLQIGPLRIHWYGIMYLIGFLGGWGLLKGRLSSPPCQLTANQLADLVFYAALGIILGGRLGYLLFYDIHEFLAHPLLIFQLWRGGMSFHGGLIGVIFSLAIFAYKTGKSLIDLTDFIAPVVPIGLGAGRIGNFINGELWGRVTHIPWGMIFPNVDDLPRHPSQLYEFFLEGVILFIILWFFSRSPRPRGAVSGLFLICYSLFRFCIEFFRQPDIQVGYVVAGLTEGQLLSLPMFIGGAALLIWAYKRKARWNNT